MSPAGTEPLGSGRHRRSPEGVSERVRASQSNLRCVPPLRWPILAVRREISPAGTEPLESERHRRSPKGRSTGALRSIEPLLCTTSKLANPLAYRTMSPAGMEPAGTVRHGRSPQGELSGESESIEPARGITTKLPTIRHVALCPRREWSRWEASDMDEAPKG